MRDSGRDRDPAGCEVSRGSPAGKRARLGSASAEKLLTEEPSCEAEDMTAPETFTAPSKRPLTTGRCPDMSYLRISVIGFDILARLRTRTFLRRHGRFWRFIG